MDMEKSSDLKRYLMELWRAFEKTGSIGAYLLYSELNEKYGNRGRTGEKKVMSEDNA